MTRSRRRRASTRQGTRRRRRGGTFFRHGVNTVGQAIKHSGKQVINSGKNVSVDVMKDQTSKHVRNDKNSAYNIYKTGDYKANFQYHPTYTSENFPRAFPSSLSNY